jgi:hypothetical protein
MKYKIVLFIICLVALLAFQAKVVIPYVYDIAASDFFLEDSGDEMNRSSSSNPMTSSAFNQCNNYIATEILSDATINFPEKPINAFSLGNFRYVINADIDIQPTDSASFTRRYVCRIQYSNDEDSSGTADPENWSVDGLSGLDNL